MMRNVLGAAMMLAMVGSASADVAGMKDILSKWDSMMKEWNAAYEFAQPERRMELEKTKPDAKAVVRSLWKETSTILENTESLPAVIWLLEHPEAIAASFDAKTQKKIISSLLDSVEHYLISSPGIGKLAPVLSRSMDLRCREILEKMRTVNPNSMDQGMAAMGIVLSMREKNGMRQDDPTLNAMRLKYLKEAIIKSFDESFGDLGKVKDIARELLYDINNLSIRRKAPSFSLPLADGSFMSIPKDNTDATLLIFWKPDSVQSASLVSKSNVLKEKYPMLEIVPICFSDPAKAQGTMRSMDISMPSLFDTKGSVFHLYRVAQVPAVYLLDKEGIVRLRGVPDMLFETILGQVMEKIKNGKDVSGKNSPKSSVSDPEKPSVAAPSSSSPDKGQMPPSEGKTGLEKSGTAAPAAPIAPPPLRPMPVDE